MMPRGAVILVVALALPGTCTAAEVVTRPDPSGKATRVRAAFYLVDVAEIDDAKRTFTADLYIVLRWEDARLAHSKADKRRVPLASIWSPPLVVLNQRNVSRLLPEMADVDAKGGVSYRQRLHGAFSARLDLHDFPLDRQTLAIRLVSPGVPPEELELVPETTARAADLSILDWEVREPSARAEALRTPEGAEVAGLEIELPVRRRASAYLYQYGIPLTLIVCMSWGAFWVSPEQLMARQSISITSMLTIITYRFVLANQLPKVAYLTRFDKVTLGCTALVFLALVEVLAVHWLSANGMAERGKALDRRVRWAFPVLFVALVGWAFLF
jgi:hypothetical protein